MKATNSYAVWITWRTQKAGGIGKHVTKKGNIIYYIK